MTAEAGRPPAEGGRPRADLVFTDAAQLVRCAGDVYDADVVADGWLAVAGETILAAGDRASVQAAADCAAAEVVDCRGRVVAPGFVDSHTHLVFGGSRVDEYAARLTTDDLEEIRARGIGVGPMETFARTREATLDEL